MNFYKHHIGDYAAATAHLSFVEDAAYSRLLRIYYRDEKPLPLDAKAVQRLAGARSKEEREAVATVLEEFFVREDDGWHNRRADAEIAEAQDSQGDAEERRVHERERKRRYRQRRGELFAQLRERGIVPPFDTPIEDLEAMVSRGTETGQPQGQARGRPESGTANQTPDTRHQTKASGPSRPVDPPQRASGLPPEVDAVAWDAFEDHHRAKGGWSLSRQTLALGQLRVLIADGIDPNAVLTWATIRNLADLCDASRRMASDAQRTTAQDEGQRPGESLADYSARLSRERLQRAATTTTPRLGHG